MGSGGYFLGKFALQIFPLVSTLVSRCVRVCMCKSISVRACVCVRYLLRKRMLPDS